MIRTKSAYTAQDRKRDGLRILVERIRGRGLPKRKYNVWMANLGPSEELLHAFQAEQITWAEFKQRYRAELFQSDALDRRNDLIKNRGQKFTLRLLQELGRKGDVTLMCHCGEDQPHCHRHVLHEILRHKIG